MKTRARPASSGRRLIAPAPPPPSCKLTGRSVRRSLDSLYTSLVLFSSQASLPWQKLRRSYLSFVHLFLRQEENKKREREEDKIINRKWIYNATTTRLGSWWTKARETLLNRNLIINNQTGHTSWIEVGGCGLFVGN